jgi:uncharacterized Zn-finger protein
MISVCRICLFKIETTSSINIFTAVSDNKELISDMLKKFASIEISEDDDLPKAICLSCLEKLNETYDFKSLIITSDSQLRQKSFQEDEIDDCNVSETINYNQKSENEEFQQHKEKYNHKGSKSKQKQKSFTCKQCNKTFKYRYYFEVHNSSHTGQKPYVCNICNKAFSMRWVLKMHSRIHTGDKPYKCEICQKTFR